MANKKRRKQSHSDRYQGYKDISPNDVTQIWVKDKKPLHSTRVAAREYIDYDYEHKLNKNTKKWLEKFTKEYYFDSYEEGKRPLHKKKGRKSVREDNKIRRRVYELTDSQPMEFSDKNHTFSPEDAIIEYIDSTRKKT